MNKFKLRIINIGMLVIFLLFISRLFYLQVIKHSFYKTKSEAQLKRIVKLYPHRGAIYDRNEQALALTKACFSAYAIPSQIKNKKEFVKTICKYLALKKTAVLGKINTKQPFVWLKRQINDSEYKKLKSLEIKGLNFIKEEKRIYPNQYLACDILGFSGIDNQGLAGLEYCYDNILKGSAGKIYLEGDPFGRQLISGQRRVIPQQDGGKITTTIDERIQYSAQKHLEAGILENRAISGQVIVMDPKTGDILAMADYPVFNPNKYWEYPLYSHKNSCVTDVYEPGSVYKVITLAAVLEEGIVTPGSVIEVPEELDFKTVTIKEAHKREEDEIDQKTVTEIITKSLNVGTTLLAEQLEKERFYKYSKFFGFGTPTGVKLPGESSGLLKAPDRWSDVDIAMISFGQAIAVTPIQIACAVSALANDGILLKPRLIRYISHSKGRTIHGMPVTIRDVPISKNTAKQVVKIMEQVVESGTGKIVQIPGYSIAGKTGTAQKARKDGLGYEKDKYVASFVGFFPAYDPQALVLVVVDSPEKKIWGSSVAGPIFKNIAGDIIDYYNILPDRYN